MKDWKKPASELLKVVATCIIAAVLAIASITIFILITA